MPEATAYAVARAVARARAGKSLSVDEATALMQARGEALARAQAQEPEVPACVACHGPERDAALPGGPGPEIAGQYETYLATQLRTLIRTSEPTPTTSVTA